MFDIDRFKELESQINQRLGFAMQSTPYNPTIFTLTNGTDAVVDEIFSYQIANKFKNHWRAASASSDPQPGMIWQDSDDDKFRGRDSATNWDIFITSANPSDIKLDDLGTPDDNTDLDFSTSLHGLVPKGTNLGYYLKDDGTWAVIDTSTVNITVTAGENISIRDVVYVELSGALGTAGRAYQADADIAAKSSSAWIIGFAVAAINSAATGLVRIAGIMTGFTGLTAGAVQYVSATAGAITETAPANSKIVGVALSTTTVLVDTRGPNDAVSAYGYNYGYFAGGWSGAVVVTADKLTYSSDTTAACTSADLSQARYALAGIGYKDTKGYFGGGGTCAIVITADKITYSTDATAACTSADLSEARRYLAGISQGTTHGYFAGGYSDASTGTADKTTFSSDSTAACTSANLSQVRWGLAGVSEGSSKGYFAGGNTGAIVATADKVTYSSDSTAACTSADLSVVKIYHTGVSGETTKGYFAGGDTGAKVATTDKITYSSDSTAACTSANLSVAKAQVAGASEGSSKGYVAGGDTGAIVATADKVTYSSDSTAACTSANLSQIRRDLSGISGNSV